MPCRGVACLRPVPRDVVTSRVTLRRDTTAAMSAPGGSQPDTRTKSSSSLASERGTVRPPTRDSNVSGRLGLEGATLSHTIFTLLVCFEY